MNAVGEGWITAGVNEDDTNGTHYQVLHSNINKIFERIIVHVLLSIGLNICFGCSKEPSH